MYINATATFVAETKMNI